VPGLHCIFLLKNKNRIKKKKRSRDCKASVSLNEFVSAQLLQNIENFTSQAIYFEVQFSCFFEASKRFPSLPSAGAKF
jgi:hypothetical protein